MYSIGFDMGSSAIKYVIMDEEGVIKKTGCETHRGNVEKSTLRILTEIMKTVGKEFYFGITGGMATGFRSMAGSHINETAAMLKAVEREMPEAGSIMEIGAQRARYISGFSKRERTTPVFAMNGSCAAGTGAFIEEQIQRLGVDFEQFDAMAKKATTIPRIAGRCSVFSKTDMIHHQQAGVPVQDILLGLIYALVRNYKANVVQKHQIIKPVLLLGGLMCSDNIALAIKDIFGLSDEEVIIPRWFRYFGAIGAALWAKDEKKAIGIEYVKANLKNESQEKKTTIEVALREFGSRDALDKHICTPVERRKGYLGVDMGSVSANFVVIDDEENVVFNSYLKTAGKPLETVERGMKQIRQSLGDDFLIKNIGTTGSGRALIGKKLGASLVVDEITAQARGAVQADPYVDTIFEIGGQDSKYISIKDKMVVDFEMNKICAAGTGAFIEEQIKKLGIKLRDFEGIALKSNRPTDLGDRCTVFIEGNIVKAIAKGEELEDIAAGLAFSIVNNYLHRVVGNKTIGNKILLQGGIAYNQAIVNAFRAILKKEVQVPEFFSTTGALGAALLTKEKALQREEKKAVAKVFGIVKDSKKALLRGYSEEYNSDKKTIGIPRVLFINKLFPMFNEIFKSLGFNVLLSKTTDEEILELSQKHSLDETCFPIKLVNGHVSWLLKQKVDYIFLPNLYTMKHSCSKARKDYACVYMQTVSKLANEAVGIEKNGVKLISPTLSFNFGKDYMVKELIGMGDILERSRPQMMLAVMKGMKRFYSFEKELEHLGGEFIDELPPEEKAFIIISRAYNIADPRLNMQIPDKLREMGYAVIELSHIPAHSLDISEDYPNLYWPFGQHILAGIKIAARHPKLFPIYITNHGCGPDTVISRFFKEEVGEKPYLHIEVDEHYSSIGVMTRVEAFVNSVENYCKNRKEKGHSIKEKGENICHKKTENNSPSELLIPHLYPYSTIFSEFLNKRGINAKEMSSTSKESMDLGKKLSLTKEYLSMIALIGDVLVNVKQQETKDYSIYIPTCEGSEISGQYFKVVENELKQRGYKTKIVSPFLEDMLHDSVYGYEVALLLAAGDIVMAADREDREYYLKMVLKTIEENDVREEIFITMAEDVGNKARRGNDVKSLCVLGEFPVVFNGFLNGYQLKAIEQDHKLLYQPMFESLLFMWNDKLVEDKGESVKSKNLKKLDDFLREISFSLKEYSPFEKNIQELLQVADDKLGLYAGGAARYRMSKLFFAKEKADGIINISSMYENTATILKLLYKKYEEEIEIPILELQFDQNQHSQNTELVDTFLKYL